MTIEQFGQDLKSNLYRLWNRMSSGSYFPGPVRAVEIQKKGGTRILGCKAVERHATQPWVMLHVRRWLQGPMLMPDGSLAHRTKGNPAGRSHLPVDR